MHIFAWGSETTAIGRQRVLSRLSVEFSDILSFGFVRMATLAKKSGCFISKHEKKGLFFTEHKMEFSGQGNDLVNLALSIDKMKEEELMEKIEKRHAAEDWERKIYGPPYW